MLGRLNHSAVPVRCVHAQIADHTQSRRSRTCSRCIRRPTLRRTLNKARRIWSESQTSLKICSIASRYRIVANESPIVASRSCSCDRRSSKIRMEANLHGNLCAQPNPLEVFQDGPGPMAFRPSSGDSSEGRRNAAFSKTPKIHPQERVQQILLQSN